MAVPVENRRYHSLTMQGLVWPELLFYFLVGVAFGSLAYINQFQRPVDENRR
jgi:hypothetical protein